jgi:hypothetical protein
VNRKQSSINSETPPQTATSNHLSGAAEVLPSLPAHYRELGSSSPGIHLNPITGEIGPLRLDKKKSLVAMAFSLVALPVWAAHIDSVDWDVIRPTTIGTKQIQPGQYQLKAEEGKSELQVIATGKAGVVATIPCHWTDLPAKAQGSEISTNGDKVTQVKFGGRTAAIQLDQ